jgi:hypothetical protein
LLLPMLLRLLLLLLLPRASHHRTLSPSTPDQAWLPNTVLGIYLSSCSTLVHYCTVTTHCTCSCTLTALRAASSAPSAPHSPLHQMPFHQQALHSLAGCTCASVPKQPIHLQLHHLAALLSVVADDHWNTCGAWSTVCRPCCRGFPFMAHHTGSTARPLCIGARRAHPAFAESVGSGGVGAWRALPTAGCQALPALGQVVPRWAGGPQCGCGRVLGDRHTPATCGPHHSTAAAVAREGGRA